MVGHVRAEQTQCRSSGALLKTVAPGGAIVLMSIKVLHLRGLSPRERHALLLLRGGSVAGASGKTIAAFSALFRDAEGVGLIISPVTSSIVHCDEKKLLAWLTLLQRQRIENGVDCDIGPGPLLKSLRICAGLLDDAGIHLGYRNAVRFLQGASASHEWREPYERNRTIPTVQNDRSNPPFARPLEMRVLSFVAANGAVATQDLKAVGASSHTIKAMRKKGLLRRVRHGLYASGQADRQGPAGSGHAGQPSSI